MTVRWPRTTPLDEFLQGSSTSTDAGERLQQLGLFGSMVGLTLAIGLIVFLTLVHHGPRREVSALLRLVGIAGAIAVVGASVELAGVAQVDGVGWVDAVTGSAGAASMMRLLAGLMVLLGLFDHSVAVDRGGRPVDEARRTPTDPPTDSPAESSREDDFVRWVPAAASSFALAGLLIGALSFAFDGHTVSRGPRLIHAVVNLIHVGAGGVWFGGIVALLVIAVTRRRGDDAVGPLVIRFSTVASFALIGVLFAGVIMTLLITDEFGQLTSTDWGRTLLVKSGAVGVVVAIGAYNHFAVVPPLERAEAAGEAAPVSLIARIRFTVAVEAAILLLVVALSVLLTTASIP